MNIQATSLQDEANCAWSDYRKDYGVSNHEPTRIREHKAFHAGWKAAKAELERGYYLMPLVELPEVTELHDKGTLWAGRIGVTDDLSSSIIREKAAAYIALTHHFEARESEAAVLARRRDELAREYSLMGLDYERLSDSHRVAIDRTLAAEDRAAAAEAEVARLKGEA